MALLWIEGFEALGTSVGSQPTPTNYLAGKYPYSIVPYFVAICAGRLGGYAMRGDSGSFAIRTAPLTTADTLICGLGLNPYYNGGPILRLYDGPTLGVSFNYNGSGEIQAYCGYSYALLGTTSGAGLAQGTWSYVEVMVKCHATAGTVEVRVNGVTKLSLTGVNTKAGADNYHNVVELAAANGWIPTYDDWYVCDNSGSLNNNFLGDVQVGLLLPNAAGDAAGWTGSGGGAHYGYVDENPLDSDTSYVETNQSGAEELWNYQDPVSCPSVLGVQVNTDCRETDAESFCLKTVIKSGATSSAGTPEVIGSLGYLTQSRVCQTDPNTGSLWTPATLAAAQFGLQLA
jgi:hypothetical protein